MLIFHEYQMQNDMKSASDQIKARAGKIARSFPMTLYFST